MEEIQIRTDFIRLDALMKFAGLTGTGGEAKSVIQDGMVRVNGTVCESRGKKIVPGDTVSFAGVEILVTGDPVTDK
jgi:ribosome-associated protein